MKQIKQKKFTIHKNQKIIKPSAAVIDLSTECTKVVVTAAK